MTGPPSKLPPDILIVLDASGSMNEDATNASCTGGCGANSKWALLTPALNQVVMQTETEVNWGLKLFADTNNTCGVSPNMVAVPIGANSAAAIAAATAARTDANGNVTNGSRTPTRSAEDAAVTYLRANTDPNPKFILMATDGQPNCPAERQFLGRRHARRGRGGHRRAHRRFSDLRRRALRPGGRRQRRAQHDGGRGRLPAHGRSPRTTR